MALNLWSHLCENIFHKILQWKLHDPDSIEFKIVIFICLFIFSLFRICWRVIWKVNILQCLQIIFELVVSVCLYIVHMWRHFYSWSHYFYTSLCLCLMLPLCYRYFGFQYWSNCKTLWDTEEISAQSSSLLLCCYRVWCCWHR